MSDLLQAAARAVATVGVPAGEMDELHALGRYGVEIRDENGTLLHAEELQNLVTTQGKNAMLDTFLGRTTAYAAAYFGLINSATAPVLADTYASHGFTEAGTSIVAARLAPTWAAAATGAKATSTGSTFTLTTGATIYGLMLVFGPAGTSAAGDTAASGGVLFSAGQFASAITVPANSTITVTYSLSV
jgi:hypothetical protein